MPVYYRDIKSCLVEIIEIILQKNINFAAKHVILRTEAHTCLFVSSCFSVSYRKF